MNFAELLFFNFSLVWLHGSDFSSLKGSFAAKISLFALYCLLVHPLKQVVLLLSLYGPP